MVKYGPLVSETIFVNTDDVRMTQSELKYDTFNETDLYIGPWIQTRVRTLFLTLDLNVFVKTCSE